MLLNLEKNNANTKFYNSLVHTFSRYASHSSFVGVYVGMCSEVGNPTQVSIMREVTDNKEAADRPVWIMAGLIRMESGSHREVFRLQTSDIDFMIWPSDHKV